MATSHLRRIAALVVTLAVAVGLLVAFRTAPAAHADQSVSTARAQVAAATARHRAAAKKVPAAKAKLTAARNDLESARARLKDARARVAAAAAAGEDAREALDAYTDKYTAVATAAQSAADARDDARVRRDAALAALNSGERSLDSAKAALESAQRSKATARTQVTKWRKLRDEAIRKWLPMDTYKHRKAQWKAAGADLARADAAVDTSRARKTAAASALPNLRDGAATAAQKYATADLRADQATTRLREVAQVRDQRAAAVKAATAARKDAVRARSAAAAALTRARTKVTAATRTLTAATAALSTAARQASTARTRLATAQRRTTTGRPAAAAPRTATSRPKQTTSKPARKPAAKAGTRGNQTGSGGWLETFDPSADTRDADTPPATDPVLEPTVPAPGTDTLPDLTGDDSGDGLFFDGDKTDAGPVSGPALPGDTGEDVIGADAQVEAVDLASGTSSDPGPNMLLIVLAAVAAAAAVGFVKFRPALGSAHAPATVTTPDQAPLHVADTTDPYAFTGPTTHPDTTWEAAPNVWEPAVPTATMAAAPVIAESAITVLVRDDAGQVLLVHDGTGWGPLLSAASPGADLVTAAVHVVRAVTGWPVPAADELEPVVLSQDGFSAVVQLRLPGVGPQTAAGMWGTLEQARDACPGQPWTTLVS